MDYEKKYKETIAWIDIIMPTLTKEQQEDALENFPELAESEDERIRKEMITAFSRLDEDSTLCGVAYNYKKWIAWLEKQKSVTCNTVDSSNDEKIRKNCIHFLELQKSHHASTVEIEECIAWLEKQDEQKPAWSEEDEEMTEDLIKGCISAEKAHHFVHTSKEIADWLKSLKQRIGWKPSEKQIHAFIQVYVWYSNNFAPSAALTSLYNDLKKL